MIFNDFQYSDNSESLAVWDTSQRILKACWDHIGPSRAGHGVFGRHGIILARLGAILERLGANLGSISPCRPPKKTLKFFVFQHVAEFRHVCKFDVPSCI